jgi:hypothetical protein
MVGHELVSLMFQVGVALARFEAAAEKGADSRYAIVNEFPDGESDAAPSSMTLHL